MSSHMHTGLLLMGLLGGAFFYVPLALWALRTGRGLVGVVARTRRPAPAPRVRPHTVSELPPPPAALVAARAERRARDRERDRLAA